MKASLPGIVVPHGGSAGSRRRLGRDDGRQRLVSTWDQFGGVFRLVQGLGDDEDDRMADIADPILCQQRLRADEGRRTILLRRGDQRPQRAEAATLEFGAGQQRQHTRRGARPARVDRHDPGMGMRRAQDVAAPRGSSIGADRGCVLDIASASGQQPKGFIARQSLPDRQNAHDHPPASRGRCYRPAAVGAAEFRPIRGGSGRRDVQCEVEPCRWRLLQ